MDPNEFSKIFSERNFEETSQAVVKYYTSLLDENLRGHAKDFEFSTADVESTLPNEFIPFCCYVMRYASTPASIRLNGNIDDMPVIICLRNQQDSIVGINFNYIPNGIRPALLDILKYFTTQGFSGSRVLGPTAKGMVLSGSLNDQIIRLCKDRIPGYDISSAIRSYKKNKIYRARMIEFDRWYTIPFFTFEKMSTAYTLKKTIAENLK